MRTNLFPVLGEPVSRLAFGAFGLEVSLAPLTKTRLLTQCINAGIAV
jgi:hypothetical protein